MCVCVCNKNGFHLNKLEWESVLPYIFSSIRAVSYLGKHITSLVQSLLEAICG